MSAKQYASHISAFAIQISATNKIQLAFTVRYGSPDRARQQTR
jgi:hypothetical protein